MAEYKHIVRQLSLNPIDETREISEKERNLIDSFPIDSFYDQKRHNIELEISDLNSNLLDRFNYANEKTSPDSGTAGDRGAKIVEIDPVNDVKLFGYEAGGVRLTYNFLNNLLSKGKETSRLYLQDISGDRTELRAFPLDVDQQVFSELATNFINDLNSSSDFAEFYLHFGTGQTKQVLIGLNAKIDQTDKGPALLLKLYKPLPGQFTSKDTFQIYEEVADSYVVEVETEYVDDIIKVPYLKGPNFDIEIAQDTKNPTEYFDYQELFSYPVTGSYYELQSLFNDKSAQISIDHKDFSTFVHFSSAEERLRNFKYKLELIDSYQDNINTIRNTGYVKTGVTGSLNYYEDLIQGIVKNFDHYDRYLYFETGSKAWPKSSSSRPYTNQRSNTNESIAFFNREIISASNYDTSNFDILTNTIPVFIKEDPNNEPYLMFIHMIAQHFDNLWIYFKAVSDKYDTDNRLDFGISKDLVRDAIESLGIKLYNAPENLGSLFSYYTGETYNSGSELINSHSIATVGTDLAYLQPMPQGNYEREIYKRIYHNIPHLIKTKGTQRGLRALINCFGIPDDILKIKTFGGIKPLDPKHLGPLTYYTGSLDKVRLDDTGSIVSGSTLSKYTSIVDRERKYSDDQNLIEVGFNMSDGTDIRIDQVVSSSFNIDDYIGDPRKAYENSYEELNLFSDEITNIEKLNWEDITTKWQHADWVWNQDPTFTRDPHAFIRMIKFFDSSLFRMIKDFVPARANVSAGVIIKSHKLARSKAKQVKVSFTNKIYTGSIPIGEVSGSDGGSFTARPKTPYTTNHNVSVGTPLGQVRKDVTDESPRLTGEFSGSLLVVSDGDVNKRNPFVGSAQPQIRFDITTFNLSLPIPPSCVLIYTGTYVGEYYNIEAVNNGYVGLTYPTTIPDTGSFQYTHNFDNYEFWTAEASPTYPYGFEGWWSTPSGSGTKFTDDYTFSFFYENESVSGSNFYARFTTDIANYIEHQFYGYTGGTIAMTYPESAAPTGSGIDFNFNMNWTSFASMVLTATPTYPYTFDGWYSNSARTNLISTNSTLTVTSGSASTTFYEQYFAKFSTTHINP